MPAVVDGRGGCGDGVGLAEIARLFRLVWRLLAISIGSAMPASAKCVSRECRSWCNVAPLVGLNTSAARR